MNWSTYRSNNDNDLLKFNGPHRGHTAEGSFTGVKHSQIIEITTSIKVGEVKIYQAATTSGIVEKKDQGN